MRITKSEDAALCQRQIEFLTLVRSNHPVQLVSPTEYSYEYIVGSEVTSASQVTAYLSTHVWSKKPLAGDKGDYLAYLRDSCGLTNRLVLESLGRAQRESSCLVHGDCTFENWLVDRNGQLVPIDPGMPRGLCCPSNDVGKLLQSWLTHWKLISQGVEVEYHPFGDIVTTWDIAALISHWYRIVKNSHRHRVEVAMYGLGLAIPTLEAWLDERGGSDWNAVGELILRELWMKLHPTKNPAWKTKAGNS